MPQSSALRKRACTIITINAQDDPNPKKAQIPNDGCVQFNASHACWLYFAPTGVFGDANGLLKLNSGPSKDNYPQQQDITVRYCVTDPNTQCTPTLPKGVSESHHPLTGGNTIKVG